MSRTSAVDAKLARIEELSSQISQEEAGLREFWEDVTARLSSVGLEVWCSELLDSGTVLVFDEPASGEETREVIGMRGLQLGFAPATEAGGWGFVVRPAHLRQGATLYTQLEHPEPVGSARRLAGESLGVRLAALHQLPELLDGVLGGQNDTLAVVRTALGENVEADARVASPFASRGNGRPIALPLVGGDAV